MNRFLLTPVVIRTESDADKYVKQLAAECRRLKYAVRSSSRRGEYSGLLQVEYGHVSNHMFNTLNNLDHRHRMPVHKDLIFSRFNSYSADSAKIYAAGWTRYRTPMGFRSSTDKQCLGGENGWKFNEIDC